MTELSALQPNGGKPRPLAEDEVHIWYVQADQDRLDLCQLSLENCLSPDETEKYLSLKLTSVRHNFLLSRGCLRHVLSRYLAIPPHELKFLFGAYGKPALEASRKQTALQFNLSHSQTRVAISIHAHHPLGIDIEHLRPVTHLEGLCRRCLTPRETNTVLPLPTPQANRRFFQYWTAKEAILKALGVGLSQPMDQIEVTLGNPAPSPQPARIPITSIQLNHQEYDSGQLQLYQWQPEPDYLGALAIQAALPNPLPKIIMNQVTPWDLVEGPSFAP